MLALRICVAALAVVAAVLAVPALTAGPGGAGVVLAVESGPEPEAPGAGRVEELPGATPDPDSTFAPEPYEPPWTWWIGVLLTAAGVGLVLAVGAGYYLVIHRREKARGRH